MNPGYVPPKDLEASERYREALEQMLKSPGWIIFNSYMQGQKQFALNGMLAAGVQPHEIARSAGAFAQLQELETWPKRSVEYFTSQINAARKGR